MALEDKDIFNAVCSRYPDQPMEYIMEQYALAKKLNINIEKCMTEEADADPVKIDEEPQEVMEAQLLPPAKRFPKRNFKVKAQDAITDDSVFCCICGLERQTLSARHLASHGLTVEEYKQLCGYAPEQKLMSRRRLAKSREIISKAQKARMDKKAVSESFNM